MSLLFILIFDAYFYWQHRWMHAIFIKQHKFHHNNPQKFWLHPLEIASIWSILFIGYAVGFTFIQMLPSALLLLTFNYFAHKEHSSKIKLPKVVSKILVPTDAHREHHNKYNVNYGAFFTFWDRAMGTYDCV